MVANGPSKKEISKMKEELKRRLGIASKIKSAMDLWPRHCSNLGISSKDKKAVEEALKNLANFDIRRNPNSVVAAVMYMVVQLSNGNNCSVQEVSKAADGVAVGTTKKTYKDIYPYASQIIPTWFCGLEGFKKLITP
nr:transcription initiation factor IIB-2-like [Malus domestica]